MLVLKPVYYVLEVKESGITKDITWISHGCIYKTVSKRLITRYYIRLLSVYTNHLYIKLLGQNS